MPVSCRISHTASARLRRSLPGALFAVALAAVAIPVVRAQVEAYPAHPVDLGPAGLTLTVPDGYHKPTGRFLIATTGDAGSKRGMGQSAMALVGPHTAEGFYTGITLLVNEAPDGMTSFTPAFIKSLPSIIANSAFDAVMLKTANLTVAKEPALSVALKYTLYQEDVDKRFEVKGRRVLVLHDHKLYTFAFTAPADKFTEQVPAFEKMIATVNWTVVAKTKTKAPDGSDSASGSGQNP